MQRVTLGKGQQTQIEESFVEKHFMTIAFAVSSFVLFILSPFQFIVGSAIGIALDCMFQPNLQLESNEKVMTVANTSFLIVGAIATLIKLTPAGRMGGYIFQTVPFLATLVIGDTFYRASKSW